MLCQAKVLRLTSVPRMLQGNSKAESAVQKELAAAASAQQEALEQLRAAETRSTVLQEELEARERDIQTLNDRCQLNSHHHLQLCCHTPIQPETNGHCNTLHAASGLHLSRSTIDFSLLVLVQSLNLSGQIHVSCQWPTT